MKTVIPGTVSTLYINELRKAQKAFLESITELSSETAYRAECERKWIESCRGAIDSQVCDMQDNKGLK